MVDILNSVLTDGLPAIDAACTEALAHASVPPTLFPMLARQRDPAPPGNILTGCADLSSCDDPLLCPLRQPL
jgi:hypothetical protein